MEHNQLPPPSDDGTAPAGEPEHWPIWALNEQERRLLWITFAGGLGSIVAGAVIIGGALALSRWFERRNGLVILLQYSLAYATVGVGLIFWQRGWLGPDRGKWIDRARRVASITWYLGAANVLLVWIGLAVNVH